MIKWVPDEASLAQWSDTDLLAEFHRVKWIAGEPVHEALLEQVRARELDF